MPLLATLTASIEARRPVALVTVTASPDETAIGRHALVWLDDEPLGELGLGELERAAVGAEMLAATTRH
ncbi:MAG: hypothetical protein H6647_12255 [Anaerolineales bacterium]|nr:hypothetical protein [Anaerolineales bacterium]